MLVTSYPTVTGQNIPDCLVDHINVVSFPTDRKGEGFVTLCVSHWSGEDLSQANAQLTPGAAEELARHLMNGAAAAREVAREREEI